MALLSSTQSSQGQMSLLGQGTSSHQRASHEQTQLKTLALIDQLQSGRAHPITIPSSVKTAISQQGLSLSSALTTIDPSLSKQLQNTLPGGCYPRLLALSTQTHESQFLKGVYELALHLQGSHHKPEALALVQWLQSQDLSSYPSLETQISELFTVLSGGGTLAQQAKSIVSEASSAEFLAPMVVGQLSFGLTRIGLAQTVMRNWGRGAKLIGSGLSAFAVEGASFSLAGQQVALAQGRLPQGLAESLPHAYWTMGWLRGTGMAASSLLTSRLGVGLLSRLGSRAPIGQKLISKAAEGTGIHLSTTQAYRLNLGPEHVENPWSQTGRTLLTFTLGGAILHAGFPAYARVTQSLHQETAQALNNSASRGLHRLQQSLRLHAQPELALAAAGPVGEFGPNLSPQEAAGLMSFRLRDHIPGLGRKNGDHTSAASPAHQGSSRSKSLSKRAKSLGFKGLENGLTGYIQLASGQRLNAWHQPGRPFPKKVQAETSPALPRSRAELILRSRAAGMGRDALARIRRDLARLEGLPEIQVEYLQLATRIETGTQEQLATPVDQLLAQWPMLESLERAEAAAKGYVEALASSELGGHKSFQEAHLIEARVAKLRTLEDYERLDEATLARWNVNPLGLHAAGRHAERLVHDPLLRRNLETVLTDPLMKSNSRVTRFRAALTEFEEKFSKLQADFIRDDVPRLKEIEAEIAANKRDIKRRRELEEERSTINSKSKVSYDRAAENLNIAMRDFLYNPATARFYVVQMRRLQLQDLAITRAPASWFRSQLTEENIEALGSEKARQAAQELLNTEAQLALARERGLLARFGHGLAYFVRLSSESPSTLLQRNLQARFTLRDEVHRDFWDFSQAEEKLTDLLSAQEAWRGACYEAHQTARAAYRSGSLTETQTELWGAYDKFYKDWNHSDLERQGRQVFKILPGELAEIEEVNKAARVAVNDFLSSVTMQKSPVEQNRKLEVAQSALAKLRRVAGKSIKTQILGVSLMSQPYATRKDTGSKFNWDASKPMIRRAAWRVPQFISAIRHGEAEAAHWRFADYGIRSFLDTGSRMVRSHDGQNPQPVSYIEMLDPLFIDIHHDAWRQFFLELPQREQQFSLDTIIEDQASTLSRETSNPQGAQIEARKRITALYEVLFGGPVEHVPNIVAKPGLSLLVHPLFAQAIDTFASSSGNMAMERDIANTRGQIGVAFGDKVKTRRGPGSQIRYGQGTMGVSEMSVLGLMGLDGLNASVYSPMGVGRSLVDADGLAAWGEFSNLVSRMGRGAFLTAGKPDDSFGMPTMSGPSVVSSRFHLGTAFIDPRFGPDSTAANLLRTTYLLHTLIPENRPHIPEAAKALDPYRKPVSLEMERQIAEAFGEAEFYPTREKLGELHREMEALNEKIERTPDPEALELTPQRERLALLQRVYQQEAIDIIGRELRQYHLQLGQVIASRLGIESTEGKAYETALSQAKKQMNARGTPELERAALWKTLELRRYQRVLAAREALLDSLTEKLEQGRPLSLREQKLWDVLQSTYAAGPENIGKDPLLTHVKTALQHSESHTHSEIREMKEYNQAWQAIEKIQELIGQVVANNELPHKRAILKILRTRERHAIRAFYRMQLGQTATPVEQRVMSNLQNAFVASPDINQPRDELVNTLSIYFDGYPVDAAEWKTLLSEEKTRKTYRHRIQTLPGQGTGSIDPLTEAVDSYSLVAMDGAGNVVAGPRSVAKTFEAAGIFLGGATVLGVAGGLDLVTLGKLNVYNRLNGPISRFLMNRMHWRPDIDSESVHHIEDIAVQAQREDRPVELNSNHLDWTDITTLNAIFYEGRFSHKKALWAVPGLGLALIGGRHVPLTRPSSKDPEKLAKQKAKAKADITRAGERMRQHGIHLLNFLPGTRSNLIGKPKTGPARIALGTEPPAVTAAISLLGPEHFMGKGLGAFKRGFGTHRRVYIGVRKIDPKNAKLPNQDDQGSRENVSSLTDQTHQTIQDLHLDQLASLQAAGKQNAADEGSFFEDRTRLLPGMELLQKTADAQTIADALEEPSQGDVLQLFQDRFQDPTQAELEAWLQKSKTDPDFLRIFNERFGEETANSQTQEKTGAAAQ